VIWHRHKWGEWADVDEDTLERHCTKCNWRQRTRQHVHDWGKWQPTMFVWKRFGETMERPGQIRHCATCGREQRETVPCA
jgi:hypothetical protein